MGEITTANMIPALLEQKPTGHGVDEKEATPKKGKTESQKELLDEIDLTGLEEWSRDEQKEAWELITEHASIFAMSDRDVGKSSLVKHSIRLTNNTPFKECYWQIPPNIYKAVRGHLKEMLDIGAIWPLPSPFGWPGCIGM